MYSLSGFIRKITRTQYTTSFATLPLAMTHTQPPQTTITYIHIDEYAQVFVCESHHIGFRSNLW